MGKIDSWCREYLVASKKHRVDAVWVRGYDGHDGHEENERCDKLARDEAQKMKDSL